MLTAPSRLRISCSRVLMPILSGRCVATTLSLQCSISGRVGRKSARQRLFRHPELRQHHGERLQRRPEIPDRHDARLFGGESEPQTGQNHQMGGRRRFQDRAGARFSHLLRGQDPQRLHDQRNVRHLQMRGLQSVFGGQTGQ